VQRSRLDIWRHFLQPAGISPQLKSVDNTLLLIQMVAADGHRRPAALGGGKF
jgi:LysR family transcriptional regulator for metE and metH